MTISTPSSVTTWVIGTILLLASANTALGFTDNEKIIVTDITVNNVTQISVDAAVGSVKFSQSADDQVHIYIKVTEKDGWGLFQSEPEDAELVINKNDNRLTLTLNDDEYGEEWRVEIPPMQYVSVDLGVGEMRIKGINANLTLDVGVGDINVRASADSFSYAKAEAGVGAAAVHSSSGNTETNRAMVSEDVHWQGNGQYSMNIEVGVGDVSITLD